MSLTRQQRRAQQRAQQKAARKSQLPVTAAPLPETEQQLSKAASSATEHTNAHVEHMPQSAKSEWDSLVQDLLAREQQKVREKQSMPATQPGRATGPRTPEGKANSSRNALRHGLTAAQTVMPWENQEEFDHLLAALQAEHDPQTITESMYVCEVAEQWWRLQRARKEEYDYNIEQLQDPNQSAERSLAYEKVINTTRRYARQFERGLHKNLDLLRKMQKTRRAAEAEQRERVAQEQRALAAAPSPQKLDQAAPEPGFVSQITRLRPQFDIAADITPQFVSQNQAATPGLPATTAVPNAA